MEDSGSAGGLEDGLREGKEDGRRMSDDEFGTGVDARRGFLSGVGLNFRSGGNEWICKGVAGV